MTHSAIKVAVWMNFPSHHQSFFFEAMRSSGIELRVLYYESVSDARLKLGWDDGGTLPESEQYVTDVSMIDGILDETSDFLHIIPPVLGSGFIRRLLKAIITRRMEWSLWKEFSHPGIRTLAVFPFKRLLGYYADKYALGTFAIDNRSRREYISWGVDPLRIALLPYSVPALSQAAAPDDTCEQFRNGRKAFLFLGALCRRKGIDILLEAFARASRLCADSDEWVLLLVGNDQSDGFYEKTAHELNIGDRLLFRGPVTPDELPGVLNASDVCVLPSRFDGWGVVVNEAASLGKPLIVSDGVGAAHHMVGNGYNGYRVGTGDVTSLSRAMISYMRDPALITSHGVNSLTMFKGFTPEINVRKFIAAVHSFRALKKTRGK